MLYTVTVLYIISHGAPCEMKLKGDGWVAATAAAVAAAAAHATQVLHMTLLRTLPLLEQLSPTSSLTDFLWLLNRPFRPPNLRIRTPWGVPRCDMQVLDDGESSGQLKHVTGYPY
jgi:hypothetical protein